MQNTTNTTILELIEYNNNISSFLKVPLHILKQLKISLKIFSTKSFIQDNWLFIKQGTDTRKFLAYLPKHIEPIIYIKKGA